MATLFEQKLDAFILKHHLAEIVLRKKKRCPYKTVNNYAGNNGFIEWITRKESIGGKFGLELDEDPMHYLKGHRL